MIGILDFYREPQQEGEIRKKFGDSNSRPVRKGLKGRLAAIARLQRRDFASFGLVLLTKSERGVYWKSVGRMWDVSLLARSENNGKTGKNKRKRNQQGRVEMKFVSCCSGRICVVQENGSGSWIRTSDQVVNSHLLYRWAMPECSFLLKTRHKIRHFGEKSNHCLVFLCVIIKKIICSFLFWKFLKMLYIQRLFRKN